MPAKYLRVENRLTAAALSRQAWFDYYHGQHGEYPPLDNITQYMFPVFEGSDGAYYIVGNTANTLTTPQPENAPCNDMYYIDPTLRARFATSLPQNVTEGDGVNLEPGEGIVNQSQE